MVIYVTIASRKFYKPVIGEIWARLAMAGAFGYAFTSNIVWKKDQSDF